MTLSKIQPVAQANSGAELGMRNRIINGSMLIDQRNSGGQYLAAGNGVYLVDRWRTISTIANKMTYQQNQGNLTPPPGFATYLGMTATTADSTGVGWWGVEQGIEGTYLIDLAYGTSSAQTVTVSFWARASIAGTYSFSLYNNNGSTTRSIVQTYTINTANTWEFKTLTFVGDTSTTMYTSTNQGFAARWDLGTNSGATTSTLGQWITGNYMRATGSVNWIATANATFQITGVQLEKGSVATPFEWRPYTTELDLCYRYFYRMRHSNIAMGMGGFLMCQLQFPVMMRGVPAANLTTTSPYWESVPWSTVGTLSSANTNNGHLAEDGGELRIGGTYTPAPANNNTYLFGGNQILFDAEL